MSKEMEAFKKHFQENCLVVIRATIEDRNFFHWKRLAFHSLNCEGMSEISRYIQETFSNEGRFSHLLPQLVVCDGFLCLTVDTAQIREKIMGVI